MIKKLPYLLASLATLFCLALVPLQPAYADTGDVLNTCKTQGASGTSICGDKGGGGLFSVIRSIIQVLLIIAGVWGWNTRSFTQRTQPATGKIQGYEDRESTTRRNGVTKKKIVRQSERCFS